MNKYNIAVVGATGMVGRAVLKALEERDFPVGELRLLASKRSEGQELVYCGNSYKVIELTEEGFLEIDIAIFAAGGEVSLKYVPAAVKKGCKVIDNSSVWRMDNGVPLVVPEVNPGDIEDENGIIANPNCSTIQSVVALSPLNAAFGLKRVVYSTYQAVSGAGMGGCKDLENGANGLPPSTFLHPIADNIIPQIDVFTDDGYTKEELKMINETRKIFHDPGLGITATAVRVPVFNGHCVSINAEFERRFEIKEVFEILQSAPGVVVCDDPKNNRYPMPTVIQNTDSVYVGRIRRDESVKNGLWLWTAANNIRKGAAVNAVQLAELLIKSKKINGRMQKD